MVKKMTMYESLEPFINKPQDKIHLSEVARFLKIPHTTARLWLNYFEKEGILIKERQNYLTFYRLNVENNNIIDHLVIFEKMKLIRRCSTNIILNEINSFFHENFSENDILIFGSFVYSQNPQDIDVLISGPFDKNKINTFSRRIKKFHIINIDLNKVSDTLKNEIIKKHLIINNSERIIRWMLW